MTDTIRWRPPLPSLGRMGGAPVLVTRKSDLLLNLQEYFTDRRSVSDFFEVRIQPNFLIKVGMGRRAPAYLSEFTPSEQGHLILSSLYFKASDNFKLKLRIHLQRRGGLNRVRQWFHTANAAVLPLLLTQGEDYKAIDDLARWALENCANNYAQFQRDWKGLKKSIRKGFAVNKSPSVRRDLRTYYTYFHRVKEFPSPAEWGRYVLTWTQTRATGLADSKMIRASIDKFCATVTTPSPFIKLNEKVLEETVHGALGVDGIHARISVGTTACLEATRAVGGKSHFLRCLTAKGREESKRPLRVVYEPHTLQPTRLQKPRRLASSRDVVYWATQYALEHPAAVRSIRVHAVAEPGKARTITVAPYAYQVLMGVFAHIFQATLRSKGVASGLTKDRHLWRFLTDTMNPQSTMWEHLKPGEQVWGLSSDLSEATDFGNPKIARQVWMTFITLARSHPNFPVGLSVLAMNLYCGKRHVFVPLPGANYKLLTTSRGWFMGDMMTKVILTVVHDYTMRLAGLKCYSLVGDDEVALSNERRRLVRHLQILEQCDLKVSREDTYISSRLIFYCEEGSLVPQGPWQAIHVNMRRSKELGYLDYPRLRLLLACTSETDLYSMTNIGRFTLLGKETRWVSNTNKPALPAFELAGLLQHVLLPQDSDTLCPYTPIEMGGDGAFTNRADFLNKVVQDKSKDPREALYRMSALMQNSFNYRFVRSERTTEVAHKHHFMMPVYDTLSEYLGDAVIKPRDAQMKVMLQSLRIQGLERPEYTWLRLNRGFYYEQMFAGKRKILQPSFEKLINFSIGRTRDPDVNMVNFVRHWQNPGFRFSNPTDYWVVKDMVERLDPLNLQWKFEDFDFTRYPSAFSIYSNWLKENVDIVNSCFEDVYKLLKHGDRLPDRVQKRLNLFMESDSYILSTLPPAPQEVFLIVTKDYNLCAEIRKRLKGPSSECIVYALEPHIYLTGALWLKPVSYRNCNPPPDGEWVEDPGSILHCDYTEFTDGKPHDWLTTGYDCASTGEFIVGYHILGRFHRYHSGVVVIGYDYSTRL